MDLYGFSKEINVLSSNKLNVKMLDTIIYQFKKQGKANPKSQDWLPVFYESLDCLKQYPEKIGEFIHLNVKFDIGIVFGILGFAIGCSFVVSLICIYQLYKEIKRENSNCNCLSERKNDQTPSKGENP